VHAGISVPRLVFDHGTDNWLTRIRQLTFLLDQAPGVRVLAPLPRQLNSTAPTTGYEDLKRIAVARVIADNIATIQVDWSLYGPKLAQVALTFGADDLDDVPVADDVSLGPRRTSVEEVRRNIQAAALVPVERNGLWGVRS
jgi:aminodeoxyfutalosine synthase